MEPLTGFYPECTGLPSQSALGSKNMCHAGLSQPGGCGLEGRESGGGVGSKEDQSPGLSGLESSSP